MIGKAGLKARRRIGGDILLPFIGVGVVQALSVPLLLVVSIIFARLLGPEDFGKFSLALSLSYLLALPVGIGISPLVTREVARSVMDNVPGVVNGVRIRCRQLHLAYSMLLITVLVLPFLTFGIGSPPLMAAGLLAPVLSRYFIDSGFIRGMHKPVLSQVALSVVRPIAVLVAAMMSWFLLGIELPEALGSLLVGSILGLVVSLWFMRSALVEVNRKTPAIFKDREWKRSYLPFVVTTGMGFLNVEIGILVLSAIGDSVGSAGIKTAQNASQVVILPLLAVNMVVQPKLTAQALFADKTKLFDTYVRGANLALLGSLVIGVPIILLAEPLVRIAFGAEYAQIAATAVSVIVLGQIFSAAVGPSGTLLAMVGKEGLGTYAQLAGLSVSTVLVIVLSSKYGAAGAAFGISVGLLVKNGVEAVLLRKIYGRWLFAFSKFV